MIDEPQALRPRLAQIMQVFGKIGAMSYGGAAITGIMQAEVQERRGWLSKERYLEGMALVSTLPGAPATQFAIFLGYVRAGWRGGVVAGLAFLLPAFVVMIALTLAYSAYGDLPWVRNAFYGLAPVVIGIFVAAVCRLGQVALSSTLQLLIAVAAALLVALTPIGVAATLLLAGCAGVALYHARAQGLRAALVLAVLIGAFQWAAPLLFTQHGAVQAGQPSLSGMMWFFFKAGALTFGGGITVLAFVQDQLVNHLRWLTPREFLDGLALGQLTPGPVLMLSAYVGYKLAGIGGALCGALAIFLPSFILILSVMPVLDRFRALAWVKAAMRAIGAAVIGVMAVSLAHMAPHAVPDTFTALLLMATVAVTLAWKLLPLPLMLAGAAVGVGAKSLQGVF